MNDVITKNITPPKRTGRPPKYTPEEKALKYKERSRKYYEEHYELKRGRYICHNCKSQCNPDNDEVLTVFDGALATKKLNEQC